MTLLRLIIVYHASATDDPLTLDLAPTGNMLVFSAEIRMEYNAGEGGQLAGTKNVKRSLIDCDREGGTSPHK